MKNIADRILGDYALKVGDAGVVPCEGDAVIALVAAAGNKGLEYTIKKMDYENNIKVIPVEGETIEGLKFISLSIQGQVLSIASDGTGWIKI